MKKVLILIVTLLIVSRAFALDAKEIIFFGDSLTDNGNLYSHSMKIIPKSPPYYEGRFSNGITWAEYFSLNYKLKDENYAVGGATAIFHRPTSKFVAPTTLTLEVYKYLIDSIMQDRSQNLYVIWIGDNDYMYYQTMDADKGTTEVVDGIISAIKTLVSYGAKNFLVLNLMDSTKTPFIQKNGDVTTLHNLILMHNDKLKWAVEKLQDEMPQTHMRLLDTFKYYEAIVSNPYLFNQVYHLNITDIKTACWQGGFTLRALDAVPNDFASSSPEMNYTYLLGQSFTAGNVPCDNPNSHIFWDEIHPTTVVHYLISRAAINLMR